MTFAGSKPKRAALAGATCLLILSGMIVGHAWPLWTGRVVTMKVVPVDPRDLFRGEYVHLDTAANQLYRAGSTVAPSATWSVVRPVDRVFEDARRGSIVYVQLAASPSGDYVPVSVSADPVAGAFNLRGRVKYASGPQVLYVDYGLDAFYMQEGSARRVEQAIRQQRNVQMQVAIGSSGRARIKTLLIDGVPVER
jgi:uncharacterized membrane-anchored protein